MWFSCLVTSTPSPGERCAISSPGKKNLVSLSEAEEKGIVEDLLAAGVLVRISGVSRLFPRASVYVKRDDGYILQEDL